MSNNAPDYKDNLVFPPIGSQDDLNTPQQHSTEVLLASLDECDRLLSQLERLKDLLSCAAEIIEPFKFETPETLKLMLEIELELSK